MDFDLGFKDFGFELMMDKILPALIILVVGFILIKIILKLLGKALKKASFVDNMLVKFIKNAIRVVLWALLILEVLKQLGVDATSLLTVFAACGAAIALALQGSLSNLAGGILIMFTRPFAYGEYIACAGIEGTVESIDLLYTSIITADGKVAHVPNSTLTGNTITNYSKLGKRRVEVSIGVSYESDIETAKAAILKMAEADDRFLKGEAMTCDVASYDDSAVVLMFRGWVASSDYWGVYFGLQNSLKEAVEGAGASIPYPQVDVHTK